MSNTAGVPVISIVRDFEPWYSAILNMSARAATTLPLFHVNTCPLYGWKLSS